MVVAAVATPAQTLVLKLETGQRLSAHSYQSDQIEWKLPAKRLENFKKSGVIIKEDMRTTGLLQARVKSVNGGVALLVGKLNLTTVDIPRQTTATKEQPYVALLRLDNTPVGSGLISVEDAAMVGLPSHAVHVGQSWQTHLKVLSTLGSGVVVFDHRVAALDNGLLKIEVSGKGQITGTEYHLPKLLPGSIELSGAAWYNLQSGVISQESYAIHNQLLKPLEGEQIGFDEHATVDETVYTSR